MGRRTLSDCRITGVRASGQVREAAVKRRNRFRMQRTLVDRARAQRNIDRKAVEGMGPLELIYRDQAVYAGAFLKTFLESYVLDQTISAVVTLDGQRIELTGLTDLIVKNTRVYAGAWVFDPTASHDDGAFELVPFIGKLDWASKAIVDLEGNPLTEAMLNTIGIEHSKPIRASCIELELTPPVSGPLSAQVDGEEWVANTRIRIDVAARALRLLVP